jgi:protein transport protein SEC31
MSNSYGVSPTSVLWLFQDAGGINFENTDGSLEIYDLSQTSATNESATLLVSVKTAARFACVDWSPYSADEKYPLGLIAAGMTDGAILIYDAYKLLHSSHAGDDDHQPLYTMNVLQTHNTQVSALKSHTLQPFQLAIGAADGRVLVIDLSDTSSSLPKITDPSASSKQSTEITAVSWNSQVSHILASSSKDGSVVVWDIVQAKQWCWMQVEHGPVSDICWNPSQGLYLLTASGDDRNPVMKVWDLGASTSMPLMTLTGHRAGILKTSWCPHDDTFLLSCAKDHTTYLWDLVSMQPIAELPLTLIDHHQASSADPAAAVPTPNKLFGSGTLNEQMHMRVFVEWSPLKRGMALTCSLDRKVQFHSILALATRAGRVAKWVKPASAVSTAFGGTIVSVTSDSKMVTIQTVSEQPDLVKLSTEFESELIGATTMVDFCERRRTRSLGYESKMWSFMEVLFLEDPRKNLLLHLGYRPEEIAKAASSFSSTADTVSNRVTEEAGTMSLAARTLVKKALLIGSFDSAVECCFRAHNYADALMIASCGGAELLQKTMDRYCDEQVSMKPYLALLQAIVSSELDDLVINSDVSAWQETLAALSTYAKSEDFPRLCVALGDRLYNDGAVEDASLCYLCSGNVEHASRHWIAVLEHANLSKGSVDMTALHEFVVKVTVLMKVTPSRKDVPASVAGYFTTYALALAEQGLFVAAASYVIGDSEASMILKDRLYRGRESQYCLPLLGVAPAFPYDLTKAATAVRRPSTTVGGSTHSRRSHGSHNSLSSIGNSQRSETNLPSVSSVACLDDQLPPGWLILQDPNSGNVYYANQSTGETSWDRPLISLPLLDQLASKPFTPTHSTVSQLSADSSRRLSIVSKYGDGFVSSSSHPELASQYGNVGTSNPYSTTRPGTAASVVQKQEEKAPCSGPIDLATAEFSADQSQVKDTLSSLYDHLASISQPSDARQLDEAKKGLDVLVKKLARGEIDDVINNKLLTMCSQIGDYDFRAATATQTAIVNSDWRSHKDWLKGLKTLLQLAVKRLY